MNKKVIIDKYNGYKAVNGEIEPNVAYVKARFFGSGEVEDGTIVLDVDKYDVDAADNGDKWVVPFIEDSKVLWYCYEGIDELTELADEKCSEDTGADFIIEDVIGFDKL